MKSSHLIVFAIFLILNICAEAQELSSLMTPSVDPSGVATSVQASVQKVTARSSKPYVPKRDYITIVGIGKTEKLDYSTQDFVHFEIHPIDNDLNFKENLSVDQYDLLLTGWLNSIYLNKFRNHVWALKYFARSLAEYAYSYNGCVDSDFYSEMIERYNNYLAIDNEIRKLNISSEIKYSLAKLYAAECIYSNEISSSQHALDKISKIPSSAVLYHIEAQSGELYQEGKFSETKAQSKLNNHNDENELGSFVGYDHGENLYYICLAYYPKFKDIDRKEQIRIINEIYLYNPTLMESPSIKMKSGYAWSLLVDWISPTPNPEVMKYSLKPYCNWVLLPNILHKG
ncbi:MAG TPA: hypothetical protein DD381_11930 [Lentisphaeria bacterium]|nr:MAG: hypothetical protein A2X47_02505 [Lentisphaerae bacterium GWF2_38_69]HBM17035.1 hypothetical protein [Lentisphaeria bacterium]